MMFVLYCVVLRLNVPVNNFSVMPGWSHHFLGITSTLGGVKSLAQGHNMADLGLEPVYDVAATDPAFCMAQCCNCRTIPSNLWL